MVPRQSTGVEFLGLPFWAYRTIDNPSEEQDMKRALTLLAGLAAAIAVAMPVAAQDTLKKIKDGGSITIGHRDASIPFSYYDDKQQPVGYAMDLCMRIVEAVKTELKM